MTKPRWRFVTPDFGSAYSLVYATQLLKAKQSPVMGLSFTIKTFFHSTFISAHFSHQYITKIINLTEDFTF